jgi:hypothetical protein
VRLAESSKIGHVDGETGEEPDNNVECLQGRPYAADFGIDDSWAVDEGASAFGFYDSLLNEKKNEP